MVGERSQTDKNLIKIFEALEEDTSLLSGKIP